MDTSTAAEGWRIPDELWREMEPLVRRRPNTHRFGGGRPRKPDRVCADAIFFVLRTGCQWKALGATAHDRSQQWGEVGFFLRLWEGGLLEYDALKGIDWAWLSMDGCMTKAPSGGKKTGPSPTDRAKKGTKRSILADGRGVPVGLAVEGANRPEFKMAREAVEPAPVSRPEAAAAGRRRQHLCLDKGDDYAEVDELVAEFGLTAHIARRGEAPRPVKTGARKKARRWVVERSHGWMNRFRGALIRWNKKAKNYIAMLHFAIGIIACRASGLFG